MSTTGWPPTCRGYTQESIAITLGAGSLLDLFDEQYYTGLEGGVLESFGRLFKNDLKIYCYPLRDQATGELTTCDNLEVKPELKNLYEYLKDRGGINCLDNFSEDCLGIFSREVLGKIKDGDAELGNDGSRSRGRRDQGQELLRLSAGVTRAAADCHGVAQANSHGF